MKSLAKLGESLALGQLWIWLLRACTALINVLVPLLLVRKFGADLAGQFLLLFVASQTITHLGRLGLDQVVSRMESQLAELRGYQSSICGDRFGTLTAIAFCATSILGLLLLTTSSLWIDREQSVFGSVDVFLMLAAAPLLGVSHLVSYRLQGRGSPGNAIASRLLPANLILVLVLISDSMATILWLPEVFLLAACLQTCVALLCDKATRKTPTHEASPRQRDETISSFVHRGFLLWVGVVSRQALFFFIPVFLARVGTYEMVAAFSILLRFAAIPNMILETLNALSAKNIVIYAETGNFRQLQKVAFNARSCSTKAALVMVVCLVPTSEMIVRLLELGVAHAQGAFFLMLFAQTVNLASGTAGFTLTLLHFERQLAVISLISTFFALLAILLLIQCPPLIVAVFSYATFVTTQNVCAYIMLRAYLSSIRHS